MKRPGRRGRVKAWDGLRLPADALATNSSAESTPTKAGTKCPPGPRGRTRREGGASPPLAPFPLPFPLDVFFFVGGAGADVLGGWSLAGSSSGLSWLACMVVEGLIWNEKREKR